MEDDHNVWLQFLYLSKITTIFQIEGTNLCCKWMSAIKSMLCDVTKLWLLRLILALFNLSSNASWIQDVTKIQIDCSSKMTVTQKEINLYFLIHGLLTSVYFITIVFDFVTIFNSSLVIRSSCPHYVYIQLIGSTAFVVISQ